jgi:hypothetical protein
MRCTLIYRKGAGRRLWHVCLGDRLLVPVSDGECCGRGILASTALTAQIPQVWYWPRQPNRKVDMEKRRARSSDGQAAGRYDGSTSNSRHSPKSAQCLFL